MWGQYNEKMWGQRSSSGGKKKQIFLNDSSGICSLKKGNEISINQPIMFINVSKKEKPSVFVCVSGGKSPNLSFFPLGYQRKGRNWGEMTWGRMTRKRRDKSISSDSNSLGHKEDGSLKSHWALEWRMRLRPRGRRDCKPQTRLRESIGQETGVPGEYKGRYQLEEVAKPDKLLINEKLFQRKFLYPSTTVSRKK